MSLPGLSFRDLEYLVAVAKLEHFGRAAEACHVSQPGLSAQVKKAEELLGLRIFERTNRRVRLTEKGREVITQCELILSEGERLFSLAQVAQEPLCGPFRLGAIMTLGPYYLPKVLPAIRKRYPKLELFIQEGLTDPLIRDLREGKLDAVLAARTFLEDGLKLWSVCFEPFELAVPKGHALASKKQIHSSELQASEMVLLEDGHCLRDQTLEFCSPSKRGKARSFHATSVETLKCLVATGFGYTLIPGLAVNSESTLKGLVAYRDFADPKVGRDVVLVTRAQHSRMDEVGQLAQFLEENKPAGTFEPNRKRQ